MRIGVLGTGNIGSMLARVFVQVPECEVTVYNRSPAKAYALQADVPRLAVAGTAREVLAQSDIVFLCTKAQDGLALMADAGKHLRPDQDVVTTISTVSIAAWEALTPARIAIAIPSIVQEVRKGVILVAHGTRMAEADQERIERLLAAAGVPFVIEESQIRVCSDLTSCGPAFIGHLLQVWARQAASFGRISAAEAEFLLNKTLIGLAAMLESGATLRDIITRVAVPAGVTEAGICAMTPLARSMFAALHDATWRRVQAQEDTCGPKAGETADNLSDAGG